MKKEKRDIRQEPEYQELKQLLQNMNADRVALLGKCLSDMENEERNTEYYTTAQAAELLGLTQAAVRVWIDNGKLKARRMGSRWRIDPASVKACLDGEYCAGTICKEK